MRIQTIHDAEEALRPYVPLVAKLTGGDTTLERIGPLMELMGNPQDKLRIVHVAGTSGKSSTCYYLAAMLGLGGEKVGLTISPHVDTITERIQINAEPLKDAVFCRELETFLGLVEQAKQAPSYFELVYAFALWVFERHGVDYAVVETGLGGLYDATNVANRPDKVCAITDIGYDHMQILGDTLPLIAAQKIGIVHAGNVAICYQQAAEIMDVFTNHVAQVGGELKVTTQDEEARDYSGGFGQMPEFQQRNWLLARRVYNYVARRDNLDDLTDTNWIKTQHVRVPGRMEIVQIGEKTLVMDGAHNQQKMKAFIDSFRAQYEGVRPAVLLALKSGKDYEQVCPLLADFASTVIVTTFSTSQDLPAVSMEPELFASALRAAGLKHVSIEPDALKAYHTLMQMPQKVCVITGSFYLLSQIRKI